MAAARRSVFERFSQVGRGIGWMLLSVCLAAVMDAMSKYLVQSYPVIQVVWARYFFQAIVVCLVLGGRLRPIVATRKLGLQIARSGLLLGASLAFVYGLKHIPLAEASTILFLAPLIVTALSVPLLGEVVGWRRWAAVAAGFVGALIIVRPGAGIFDMAVAFPVATAVFYAFYMIATRRLSRFDPALTTLFYTALVGALALSAVVPLSWRTPDVEGWGLMVVLGGLGGLCHFALIRAFAAAPAVVITPFEYSRLIWAAGFGLLLFGDFPDGWTMLGALIIVGSGLYVFHRERQQRTRTEGTG